MGEDADNDGTTGEGRVVTRTVQGTYSYDPDKPEITWEWDTRTENGTTDTNLNWTETYTQLYTTNGTVDAFIESEDTANQYVKTRVFTDRNEDGDVTYHDENQETFTLDTSAATVSLKETQSQGDTIEDAGLIEEREVTIEDVATFPGGESWSRGKP